MNNIDAFPLSFNDKEICPGARVIHYAPMEKGYLRWATVVDVQYIEDQYKKDKWVHKIILQGDGMKRRTSTLFPDRIIVMDLA